MYGPTLTCQQPTTATCVDFSSASSVIRLSAGSVRVRAVSLAAEAAVYGPGHVHGLGPFHEQEPVESGLIYGSADSDGKHGRGPTVRFAPIEK